MRGGEWCCATALARDGVPCGLSPMALFMCREWHWRRRNEGVQRGFEKQQLVDVCESLEYACAAPHERAVHAAAFVLRGSGSGSSLLSWGVGAKPSVLIRSRALHVTGVGVFVEHLLPPPPLLRLASAVVGAEDFGLGDVPQRCWCPRARPCAGAAHDHVPSLGETQGHTGTCRARVSVYSSCPPPSPSAAVLGTVDLGRRACGLPNSRTPTRSPPPSCDGRAVCL